MSREEGGKVVIEAGGLVFGSAQTFDSKTKSTFAKKGLAETDLMHLSYPLVHEGINANGVEFIKEEMKQAYSSLIGTPLDKDHELGIDSIVGMQYDAKYEEIGGKGIIIVEAYIYASLYPDIAIKLQDGSINGVSMECRFEWAERAFDRKTIHGIEFFGGGLVRQPADKKAIPNIKKNKDSKVTYSHNQSLAVSIAVASILAKENINGRRN